MNTKSQPQIEYFHYISSTGCDRYFKVDWINDRCTQVVLSSGEKKKGRPHMVGAYRIQMTSFRGTYHWYYGRPYKKDKTRCLATNKNQYDKALQRVLTQI